MWSPLVFLGQRLLLDHLKELLYYHTLRRQSGTWPLQGQRPRLLRLQLRRLHTMNTLQLIPLYSWPIDSTTTFSIIGNPTKPAPVSQHSFTERLGPPGLFQDLHLLRPPSGVVGHGDPRQWLCSHSGTWAVFLCTDWGLRIRWSYSGLLAPSLQHPNPPFPQPILLLESSHQRHGTEIYTNTTTNCCNIGCPASGTSLCSSRDIGWRSVFGNRTHCSYKRSHGQLHRGPSQRSDRSLANFVIMDILGDGRHWLSYLAATLRWAFCTIEHRPASIFRKKPCCGRVCVCGTSVQMKNFFRFLWFHLANHTQGGCRAQWKLHPTKLSTCAGSRVWSTLCTCRTFSYGKGLSQEPQQHLHVYTVAAIWTFFGCYFTHGQQWWLRIPLRFWDCCHGIVCLLGVPSIGRLIHLGLLFSWLICTLQGSVPDGSLKRSNFV